jgi:hypothetical protein
VFALKHPEVTPLHTQYIRTLVARATNKAYVVKSVREKKAGNVSLERLPWAEQEPSFI